MSVRGIASLNRHYRAKADRGLVMDAEEDLALNAVVPPGKPGSSFPSGLPVGIDW